MALKTKIVQVATASTKVSMFSSTTLCKWGHVGPHTSNTGIIFVGDGVVTNQTVIRTGDIGLTLAIPKDAEFDAVNLYVNSLAVSNQAVFIYMDET